MNTITYVSDFILFLEELMAFNLDSLPSLLVFRSLKLKFNVKPVFNAEERTEASAANPQDCTTTGVASVSLDS